MQKRGPDLMVILTLFVGLGIIVTTTVQGAEISAPRAPAAYGSLPENITSR